jgi:hypothetical protein
VLLLAGQYDPVTPPRYADEVAKGLSNARVLVLKGQGHSVMSAGCTPQLVKHFVEKARSEDAGCKLSGSAASHTDLHRLQRSNAMKYHFTKSPYVLANAMLWAAAIIAARCSARRNSFSWYCFRCWPRCPW